MEAVQVCLNCVTGRKLKKSLDSWGTTWSPTCRDASERRAVESALVASEILSVQSGKEAPVHYML